MSGDEKPVQNSWIWSKKRVRQAFCNAAPFYDSFAGLQRKIGRLLIERVPTSSANPLTVLDVGCGTGFCLSELTKTAGFSDFIGLDISEGMLRQAHQRLGRRARYICADAECLPVFENTIDLIISNLSLQWCRKLSEVFSGFQRILKPGGILLFSSLGIGTLRELRFAWQRADAFDHVNRFYSADEITTLMGKAGLPDSETASQTHVVLYASVLELLRELKGIGAHKVLEGRRPGLTGKSAFKRMLGAYPLLEGNDKIPASYEILFGQARKSRDKKHRSSQIRLLK